MRLTTQVVGVEAPDLPRAGWGQPLVHGVFHRPASAPPPRTAFIAIHYNLDFSQHYLARPLASRGFGFLGWNTRFCGREPWFLFDRALLDIARGVGWLREQGAETVVLLGNSGGGSLMAAYQAQTALDVVRPIPQGPGLADLGDLPRGDLYASVAAHPGRPEVLTSWLDPAVIDERDPAATDADLDMYDARNGPPYEPEFVERYRHAQRARNRRISEWAQRELARLNAAGYSDRLFTVSRTWADLRFTDPALDPSDRPTPACYRGDPARANRSSEGIGTVSTLRTWLAMWSLDEVQCRATDCLAAIGVPALVVQATQDAGVFPSDAQAIFDALQTADKQLHHVAGDHYFTGAGGRDELADLLASWVREREG